MSEGKFVGFNKESATVTMCSTTLYLDVHVAGCSDPAKPSRTRDLFLPWEGVRNSD